MLSVVERASSNLDDSRLVFILFSDLKTISEGRLYILLQVCITVSGIHMVILFYYIGDLPKDYPCRKVGQTWQQRTTALTFLLSGAQNIKVILVSRRF